MNPFDFLPILILAFVLALAILAVALLGIAWYGGWWGLAAVYRSHEPFVGKRWHWQDLGIGPWWMGYSGGVTVGANADGFYFALCFRIGHPPLFIPWSDLVMTPEEHKVLGFRVGMMRFEFPQVPNVRFYLSERVMAKIAAEVGTKWNSGAIA